MSTMGSSGVANFALTSIGQAVRTMAVVGVGGNDVDVEGPSATFNFMPVFGTTNPQLDPRITFSRASNATVVGSDGLIQYAPHNLLTFSEQFDASVWSKVNSTVTANATTAPNGTTTADLFSGTGTSAAYLFTAYAAVAGVPFYLSCHVKNFSLTGNATVWIRDFTEVGLATFDLATGTVNSFSGIASEATIVDVGNGWYRISAKFTPTTTGNHNISPVHIGTAAPTTGFYAWGAQLNVAALQDYYPTTVKNLLGFSEAFDNAAWTKSNSFIQTNLLLQSEAFDSASWSKTLSTVSANQAVSPDGIQDADKLEETATSGYHFTSQTVSISSGAAYTATVYAKASERNFVAIQLGGVGFSNQSLCVDLTTGATVTANSPTAISATSVGNGWWRISVTGTSTGTSGAVLILTASTLTNNATYAGTAGFGVFIWGAQLVQGSVAGDYQQTTSVALPVMYQDPNGTMTADKLVENTVNAGHTMDISTTVISGTTYTTSIYAKAGERTQFSFRTNSDNTNATFNLSAGTIGTVTNGTGSITAVGNGWYRCSLTWAATSSASVVSLRVRLLDGSGNSSYTGDGTSGIYIWGAQLSDSASLDQYVNNPVAAPSSTAYYGPRFDYDPVTLQPKGLLIEEQRTNSVLNNSMVGAVAGTPGTLPTNWGSTTPANGITRQIVGTGTEDGIAYIDFRFSGTNTLGSKFYMDIILASGTISAAQGQTWTESAYVRLIDGAISGASFAEAANLLIYGTPGFNDNASKSIETASNAKLITQRFSLTKTFALVGTTAISPRLSWSIAAGATIDFTLRIGFPQLELGAFPTSVIPTTTAQVTRSADVAVVQGSNFSSWYNVNEGTVSANFSAFANSTNRYVIDIEQSASANSRIDININSSNVVNPRTVISGSAIASLTGGTYTVNTLADIAFAYKVIDYASSFNGATAVTATTAGVLPSNLGRMYIGSLTGSSSLNGHIRQVAYFPRRLQNSELQAITS